MGHSCQQLAHGIEENCIACGDNNCFVRSGLSQEQLHNLSQITNHFGPFKPGDAIFKIEDPFKSLYVIQSGTVKIETVSADGFNLVDGFYFHGDIIGLEAIGSQFYSHDAIALEETWVCELPYKHLESLCAFIPKLQHKMLVLMGNQLRHMNEMFLHGRHLSAEERLLLFFKMLCHKKAIKKQNSFMTLSLTMSKGDIASYLGIRAESLSRALTKLQKRGVLSNQGKCIEIHNIDNVLKFSCN